jgi:hypothetical protein
MKKIKQVNKLEVKRTFIIAQLTRKQKLHNASPRSLSIKSRHRFLKDISLAEWKYKLRLVKKKVLSMPEKELDKIIRDEYKKRFVAFDNYDWFIGEVRPTEVGVWRRAGKLPLEWTNGSLKETADKVKQALAKNSKRLTHRGKHVVLNILKVNVSLIQKDKYLLPIIFKGGTGTNGRKRLKRKMAGDIDDGCMRSIALTISGVKKIKAYLGYPK